MRLKDIATKVTDLLSVDPRKLEVDPAYNVRGFDPANDSEDAWLLADIRRKGVAIPLTIRANGEQVLVVAGHRRLSAVRMLLAEGVDIKTVPCQPEPRGTSDVDRTADLIRSNSGKPLTPLQKAEVYKRLMGYGWTEQQLADELGVVPGTIRNGLDLAAAPADVKAMVADGSVAATLAVRTVRAEGDKAGAVLAAAKKADPDGKVKPRNVKPTADAKAAKGKAKGKAEVATPAAPAAKPAAAAPASGLADQLDAIVDQLTRLETNTAIPLAARQLLERARVAAADAWDILNRQGTGKGA